MVPVRDPGQDDVVEVAQDVPRTALGASGGDAGSRERMSPGSTRRGPGRSRNALEVARYPFDRGRALEHEPSRPGMLMTSPSVSHLAFGASSIARTSGQARVFTTCSAGDPAAARLRDAELRGGELPGAVRVGRDDRCRRRPRRQRVACVSHQVEPVRLRVDLEERSGLDCLCATTVSKSRSYGRRRLIFLARSDARCSRREDSPSRPRAERSASRLVEA